jgi:hypothetical protein
MDAGVRAETGRFDVTWTEKGYYRYYYTENEGFDYRYDRHPRADVPEKHLVFLAIAVVGCLHFRWLKREVAST